MLSKTNDGRRDLTIGTDKSLRAGTSRRQFLTWSALVGALAFTPELAGRATASAAPSTGSAGGSAPSDFPFRLGVASGDPLPDAVVLWTRLAVDPLAPFGGMTPGLVPVSWEISRNPAFTDVVSRGVELATDADGFSVHVDVRGLEPAREYFYRFASGAHISSVGRTKTAPAYGASIKELTFAWASCQKWEDGFYSAYGDMATENHDVIFFLGDYIYEYALPADGGARKTTAFPESMKHEAGTLADYRDRYALYKSDVNLAAAHASAPWIVTFDDHEVDNNWASAISQDNDDPRQFLLRRADAFKAWWENTPVRANLRPVGPDMRVYRRFSFGDLVDFSVLDTRQYRSDQVNGDTYHAQDALTADPSRTITGTDQERWILDGFNSPAKWKFLAHQTVIADLAVATTGERQVGMDGWSGYEASRHRILDGARDRGTKNLVSFVGDIHRTIVSELRRDYQDDTAPVVGVEYAGTSITSGKDGADLDASGKAINAASPHVKFGNSLRGHVRTKLTHDTWTAELRTVDAVSTPNAPARTRSTIVVPNGRSEIQLT